MGVRAGDKNLESWCERSGRYVCISLALSLFLALYFTHPLSISLILFLPLSSSLCVGVHGLYGDTPTKRQGVVWEHEEKSHAGNDSNT